jgi:large subunit ribosomal protein L28
MSKICEVCGKKPAAGRNVSHSHRVTNRWFKPNIQRITIRDEKGRVRKARKLMTKYTVETAQKQFEAWKELEELLLVKFMDGNVKAQEEDGSLKHSKYHDGTPAGMSQPGYTDFWKEAVVKQHGEVIKSR